MRGSPEAVQARGVAGEIASAGTPVGNDYGSRCGRAHPLIAFGIARPRGALRLIQRTLAAVKTKAEGKAAAATSATKLTKALGALETYVSGLADLIIDYASARLDDEPFSTSPTDEQRAPCGGCCIAGWGTFEADPGSMSQRRRSFRMAA